MASVPVTQTANYGMGWVGVAICGTYFPHALAFLVQRQYRESQEDIWSDPLPSDPAVSTRPDRLCAVLVMPTLEEQSGKIYAFVVGGETQPGLFCER